MTTYHSNYKKDPTRSYLKWREMFFKIEFKLKLFLWILVAGSILFSIYEDYQHSKSTVLERNEVISAYIYPSLIEEFHISVDDIDVQYDEYNRYHVIIDEQGEYILRLSDEETGYSHDLIKVN